MRIAMVSEHASPLAVVGSVDAGGQNVHVAALASALAARRHEVVVYTRRDSPSLPDRVPLCAGVVVEHLDAGPAERVRKDDLLRYVPELAMELRRRLPAFGPAVLHGHFWMSGLAAVRAARELGLPTVQTFHALGTVKRRMQGASDTSPVQRVALERELARDVDRIIASCGDEARELIRLGGRMTAIDIVPSGVDCSWFVPQGIRRQRRCRYRLLVVGRLVPRKGVADAITALSQLLDTELVVAGGPDLDQLDTDPEAIRLRKLARDLGVADRVHLMGQVPHTELPALIRSADLVLCLPWYEPFGIVPLEAMACGVPVVGTAVGGLLDTVIDNVTGVLLPPRRPDLTAATIEALLGDEERRRQMSAAGLARVAHYTWDRVAAATERTYLRAVVNSTVGRHDDNACKESVG